MNSLRKRLVELALLWQETYGVAPSITHTVSEFDAASMVGMPAEEYSTYMKGRSAVARGHDFAWEGIRYQVKANRPSGRKGSPVTLVGKPKNLDWEKLIWVLYDREYRIQEAWLWTREAYQKKLHDKKRLSPRDMRQGKRIDTG
jgi:hypothetical protein